VEFDPDDTCGVCLDKPARVRLLPCQHELCAGCCRSMSGANPMSVLLCPFCRASVRGFRPTCC
jgi:hypothetical protein